MIVQKDSRMTSLNVYLVINVNLKFLNVFTDFKNLKRSFYRFISLILILNFLKFFKVP